MKCFRYFFGTQVEGCASLSPVAVECVNTLGSYGNSISDVTLASQAGNLALDRVLYVEFQSPECNYDKRLDHKLWFLVNILFFSPFSVVHGLRRDSVG